MVVVRRWSFKCNNLDHNIIPECDISTGSVILTLTGQGTGECALQTDMDQIQLTIDPMPTFIAGNDESFCVKDPIILTGAQQIIIALVNWTGGDGIFNDRYNFSPYTCLVMLILQMEP